VARAFGDALEQVGFVTVVGHAVDAALMTATYDVARILRVATTDKLASCRREKRNSRGYLPVGIESVPRRSPRDAADLCEALVFRALSRPSAQRRSGRGSPRALRALVERYDQALEAWARTSCGFPRSRSTCPNITFDRYFDEPAAVLRFVNYPISRRCRCRALRTRAPRLRWSHHLRQDAAPGGLEICDAGGAWHAVPPSGNASSSMSAT